MEVERLNRTLGQALNASFELVRWETHAWPGFGQDAQEVINTQIALPYDIFVGVMWSRLGSPSRRAPSGTVEEFERAYEQWERHRRPQILFYFRESALASVRSDDRGEHESVRAFRKIIAEKGGFTGLIERGPNSGGWRTSTSNLVRLRALLASEALYYQQPIRADVIDVLGSTSSEVARPVHDTWARLMPTSTLLS